MLDLLSDKTDNNKGSRKDVQIDQYSQVRSSTNAADVYRSLIRKERSQEKKGQIKPSLLPDIVKCKTLEVPCFFRKI